MSQNYVTKSRLQKYREDNKPETCPILGHDNIIPVVDHDHKTGRIRGVISSQGNALIGKIENFHKSRCISGKWDLPTVLRAIAEYLEKTQGPLHPIGTRQITKRFGRSGKIEQIDMMRSIGITEDEINSCNNSSDRTKLYRSKIIE